MSERNHQKRHKVQVKHTRVSLVVPNGHIYNATAGNILKQHAKKSDGGVLIIIKLYLSSTDTRVFFEFAYEDTHFHSQLCSVG